MAEPQTEPRSPDFIQYDQVTTSQLPLLSFVLGPSHEKRPSKKDTVLAINCTVTNYSKT